MGVIKLVPTIFLILVFFSSNGCYSEIFYGQIKPGFRASEVGWIDNSGIFFYSKNQTFGLGFLNPAQDPLYFLSVTHVPSSTIIWTANRDFPVSDSDYFEFGEDGNASLKSGMVVIWTTGTAGQGVQSMELQESGNLVLLDSTSGVIWQSFDFPTDTLVSNQVFRAGMKLVSKNGPHSSNLSSGSYVLEIQQGDLVLFADDFHPSQTYWSLQKDDSLKFPANKSPESVILNDSGWGIFGRDMELLWQLQLSPANLSMRFAALGSDGIIRFTVIDFTGSIDVDPVSIPEQTCDTPNPCGFYSLCYSQGDCGCPSSLMALYPSCSPFSLFSCPQNQSESATMYKIGEGFSYFALPFISPENVSGLLECQQLCLESCSCNVVLFSNISNSCYLLSQVGSFQLSVNKTFSFDVYMKTHIDSSSNLDGTGQNSDRVPIAAGVAAGGFVIVVVIGLILLYRKKRKNGPNEEEWFDRDEIGFFDMVPGLPTRFSYSDLQIATGNFQRKVGVGGFGSVYEGHLSDGRRVAVKQLEKVGHGQKEFQAEVASISSIHHLNLMKLCGYCSERNQRLLVYDYMPHGSLDKLLFSNGTSGSTLFLDWGKRCRIAIGTAKALAYLHEECSVKIIHCDVKPENILLDEDFSPKLSDFGMAKLLSREESRAVTLMRGTRGYLAPEWLTTSEVSAKSDVYSFGAVLMEIIGGRRNFDQGETSDKCYFPAYAYRKMLEGKVGEVVDERVGVVEEREVERCLKVALWCLQEEAGLRPSMGKVVKMLTGEMEVPVVPMSSPAGFRLHLSMLRGEREEPVVVPEGSKNLDMDFVSSCPLSGSR